MQELKIDRQFRIDMQKLVDKEICKGTQEAAGVVIVCGTIVANTLAAIAVACKTDVLDGIEITCKAIRSTASDTYVELQQLMDER